MPWSVGEQHLASLGTLCPSLIEALSHDRCLSASCDHRRIQRLLTPQTTSDMQTPTMAGGRHCPGCASRLPGVREIRLSAAPSPITLPKLTLCVAFTSWQASQHRLATAVFVRFWSVRRRGLEPLPARALFEDARAGFGTDARAGLLVHRFDNLLDVLRRVVEPRLHFLLLVSREERRPSAPGPILSPD
jgi:hypothetical protein